MPKIPWIKGPSIRRLESIVSTYIKRGNPNFWGSHQKPRICLPLGSRLQGGGLRYSTKKSWRKGLGAAHPLWPAGVGGAPCAAPPAAAAALLCLFLHDRRLHRHLHRQFLLVYSGSSSHTLLYLSVRRRAAHRQSGQVSPFFYHPRVPDVILL